MNALAREPIFTRGAATTLATLIVGALVVFGVPMTPDQQRAVIGLFTFTAPVIVTIVTWLWARRHTTPLNSPRNAAGEPLFTAKEHAVNTLAAMDAQIRETRAKRDAAGRTTADDLASLRDAIDRASGRRTPPTPPPTPPADGGRPPSGWVAPN